MTEQTTMANDEKTKNFFSRCLEEQDIDIAQAIRDENRRQNRQIELIASENIVSRAVMQAMGSVMTNKYAEGYPGRRYYSGCEHVDSVEQAAIDRAGKLFDAAFVNVQAHSGAQANLAVLLALLKPGATILGMDLSAGGHLTHGSKVTISGKWFNATFYGVRKQDGRIDLESVASQARAHNPALIILGASAYPRALPVQEFRAIADEVGAFLMVDMAHIAGMVATGELENPVPLADVVTSTTHKTLRGPRGGLILSRDGDIGKKINSAVFPGMQGGPLMHQIAAKAVAFGEALHPDFAAYSHQMVKNAQALADQLCKRNIDLVTGGTDNHMVLVDLRSRRNINGAILCDSLDRAGLTCNRNAVPFDPLPPKLTSGVRLGSPAGTTRGFRETEFRQVGDWIADLADMADKTEGGDVTESEQRILAEVTELTGRFPIYEQAWSS